MLLDVANLSEGGEQKIHMCTLPACFYAKQSANVERQKAAALQAGGIVIEGQKAESYIFPDGTPRHDSGMVNLDQVPTAAEIVGDKKAPKWRAMVEGKVGPVTMANKTDGSETQHEAEVRVKPVVVIDAKGRAHHLVERKLAIEAAKANGYGDVFTAKSKRQSAPRNGVDAASKDAEKKRKDKEQAKKKFDAAVAVAAVEELVVEIAKQRVMDVDVAGALLEVAIFHAAFDAKDFVCARRAIEVIKGDHEKALRVYAKTLDPQRMPGFVIELLLAGWVKASGIEAPGFIALAEEMDLDLKGIREMVKAQLAAPKSKAKPKKPEPPPKPVRDLIGELAPKHGIKSLVKLDDLSMKTVGKPYEALQGPELTQLVEAIKALPLAEKKGGAK